ncbi:MAG: phosphoadenylyl-sulfate reductase [Reyranellaceae bacterium]
MVPSLPFAGRDADWLSFSAGADEKSTRLLLEDAINGFFRDRIALVSSFGAEAAVLLHLVARIDRTVPVIFLDTGKLFDQTLRYRDALAARLDLADLRVVEPDATALALYDPDGLLFRRDPEACCRLRKVEPLERALQGFAAWIDGRQRFQGGQRDDIAVIEQSMGRIKFNPLARWSAREIDSYFSAYDLPRHPLAAEGYRSIGCTPCSAADAADDPARPGRWRGQGKRESGIRLPHGSAASPLIHIIP